MFQRSRHEDGQAAPLLLLAFVALAMTALALVQGGRIGLLSAEAATGADAAALAAADSIAEDLEGFRGIGFLITGRVPDSVRARAAEAAGLYAGRNDTTVRAFDAAADGRRRVTVQVDTRTSATLGEPALNAEMQGFRAESVGAAEVELKILGPSNRGCLTGAELAALGDSIGVTPIPNSGLLQCSGADVRNLHPAMLDAVVRLEVVMGSRIWFVSGYRSIEEQIALYNDPTNPYPVAVPGTSYHEVGLAIDVANPDELAAAINSGPPDMVRMCQPLPIIDDVHFSHRDYGECGGPMPRPAGPTHIEAEDPRLIDPADR